jgi:hypothetical protein
MGRDRRVWGDILVELDPERLAAACDAVVDALKSWPPEYKIAALHILIDSFPSEYIMAEKRRRGDI